jgi:PEP-CTERM motif
MKNRVILASLVAFTLTAASVKAQSTIAQWTFESQVSTNITRLAAAPGPNNSAENGLNSGASSTTFGQHATAVTYSYPAGDIDNGSGTGIDGLAPGASGPGLPGSGLAGAASSIHSESANGWSVGDYWQFQTSTLGFNNIEVAWDQAGSGTGPRDFLLQYSTDNVTYTTIGGTRTVALSAWTTSSVQPASFLESGFAGALNNQTTVFFRLVDNSTTSIAGATVGTGGTDRVDNFTVIAVPEPSTVLLVGAGLIGMLAMRRRRS